MGTFLPFLGPPPVASQFAGTGGEIPGRNPHSSPTAGLLQFTPQELETTVGAAGNTSYMFPEVALEPGREGRPEPEQASIHAQQARVPVSYTGNSARENLKATRGAQNAERTCESAALLLRSLRERPSNCTRPGKADSSASSECLCICKRSRSGTCEERGDSPTPFPTGHGDGPPPVAFSHAQMACHSPQHFPICDANGSLGVKMTRKHYTKDQDFKRGINSREMGL